MLKSTTSKLPYFAAAILLIALIAITSSFLNNNHTTAPESALSGALEMTAKNDFAKAIPLLETSAKDAKIKHWANLIHGKILEEQGNYREAVDLYKKIPSNTAASLDMRVALVRLLYKHSKSTLDTELNTLESDITKARRTDLMPELFYLRAKTRENIGNENKDSKQIQSALDAYTLVRRKYPASPFAKLAREATNTLLKDNPSVAQSLDFNTKLEQSNLLLKENQPLLALETVQNLKQELPEMSKHFFELLFVEQRALDKLHREEEAKHLLLTISADGNLETADKAILQIAKNSWNVNDNQRALKFIDSLSTRFPNSSSIEKAHYIKARILEEVHQYSEAKHIYLDIHKTATDKTRALIALTRVAWLYLRNESYIFAAKSFKTIHSETKELIENLRAVSQANISNEKISKDLNTLEKLLKHSIFWYAFSLNKLDETSLKDIGVKQSTSEDAFKSLVGTSHFGYYSLLAQNALSNETSPSTPDYSTKEMELSRKPCTIPIPVYLETTLKKLKSSNAHDFARHEINWYFSKHLKTRDNEQFEQRLLRKVQLIATRTNLYNTYTTPKNTIREAARVFKLDKRTLDKDARLALCLNFLNTVRHPMPYLEYFKSASSKFEVPLALLLAITRTESHFDPFAVSTSGAIGLMQLMPKTAKSEGLQKGQELHDPRTNITIGAKHLSRLMSYYDGNKTLTIAAYNAGRSAVNRWRSQVPSSNKLIWTELIGYPETKNYVKKVLLAEHFYKKKTIRP